MSPKILHEEYNYFLSNSWCSFSPVGSVCNTPNQLERECQKPSEIMLGAGKVRCSLPDTFAENHLENTLLQSSNCDVFLKHLPLYAIKYLIILLSAPLQKIIKPKQIETCGKEQNSQSCMVGVTVLKPQPVGDSVIQTCLHRITESKRQFCIGQLFPPHSQKNFSPLPSFLPAKRFLLVLGFPLSMMSYLLTLQSGGRHTAHRKEFLISQGQSI